MNALIPNRRYNCKKYGLTDGEVAFSTKTVEASEFNLKPPLLVGIPGLEPGITGPESVVLPITPYPNFLAAMSERVPLFRKCDAKVVLFRKLTKGLGFFFR